MQLKIYKPNEKNTGSGFSFSIDSKSDEPTFYVNAILQHQPSSQGKAGSFLGNKGNPDKTITFKLNMFELGEILSSIKSRVTWQSYHNFNNNSTSITFAPWDKTRKIKSKNGQNDFTVPAFGIQVVRNGSNVFKISLDPGEVEALKELIRYYFNLYYSKVSLKYGQNKKTYNKPLTEKPNNQSSPPEEDSSDFDDLPAF